MTPASGCDDGSGLIAALRKEGVTAIRYLLLSHPHSDHIGGAAALLESFSVKQI